jgi:hypothetical protein
MNARLPTPQAVAEPHTGMINMRFSRDALDYLQVESISLAAQEISKQWVDKFGSQVLAEIKPEEIAQIAKGKIADVLSEKLDFKIK